MEGYSICLNEWALDTDIKSELGLLCIISSLCANNGICTASNEYFAELFNTDNFTISRKLKKLESKNYITIEYTKRGCEVIFREIRLTEIANHDCEKTQPTIAKKRKENNIYTPDNNIIINNNILSAPKGFVKPSVEDVKAYCEEKDYKFDPESFVAYYESNGWMVGKSKMKNWKAACTTWARNGFSKKEEKQKEFYW